MDTANLDVTGSVLNPQIDEIKRGLRSSVGAVKRWMPGRRAGASRYPR
jgi:hypothetical protein